MKKQFTLQVRPAITGLLVSSLSGHRTKPLKRWLKTALIRLAPLSAIPQPALARIRATRPR